MEKTATISIEGMSCEHCVKAVKDALEAQKGVRTTDVSLEGKSARVVYDEELVRPDELKAVIIDEGYQVIEGS